MNEFFSDPLTMFVLILCSTLFVGVTIGVIAGYILSKRRMKKWLASQSTLVNQNIATWYEKLKPIEGHVNDLNQTKDDFSTTQERYEQLEKSFQNHEGKIGQHMSTANNMFREYQLRLDEKEDEESAAAKEMKDQLQQLRQFASDGRNHHKYNSLVQQLPALKSEIFEKMAHDFYEKNLQFERFKQGLDQEKEDALLKHWENFGELIAAMIRCIAQVFVAECTKAIDPSRTQQMDKKLEEISQEFTEKTEKFVEEMAAAQKQLQDYSAEIEETNIEVAMNVAQRSFPENPLKTNAVLTQNQTASKIAQKTASGQTPFLSNPNKTPPVPSKIPGPADAKKQIITHAAPAHGQTHSR